MKSTKYCKNKRLFPLVVKILFLLGLTIVLGQYFLFKSRQKSKTKIDNVKGGPNKQDFSSRNISSAVSKVEEDSKPELTSSTKNRSKFYGISQEKISPLSEELQAELKLNLLNATDKKTIIIWVRGNPRNTKTDWVLDEKDCGNCEVTLDKSKLNDKDTAAVLINFQDTSPSNLPKLSARNPNHLYIFWIGESPSTVRNNYGKTLDFEESYGFNATMGYRRDYDFTTGYQPYRISTIVEENKLSLDELLKMKTKTAITVISDCGFTRAARTRINLVNDIKKAGFNVETLGSCFGGSGGLPRGRGEEFRQAIRKYKFHFSFENSYHCKDYITEKFFNNALRSLTVPVVWGAKREDYEGNAPSGSFIYVEDFPSIEKLVEYLNYLDKNDTAYLQYLKWLTMKPSEMPQYGRAQKFCTLCRVVHGINVDDLYSPRYSPKRVRPLFTDGLYPRIIPSLKGRVYGEEDEECLGPGKYPPFQL